MPHRFGHHEKARMQGELVSPPPTSTSTTKSPKRVKFAEPLSSSSSPSSPPSSKTASPNPSFTAADGELDFASCFNLFAASSNGSALLPQPSSRPPQTRDSASIAAELHAALSAFEARLPGWAVAGVDLWEPATVLQNAVSCAPLRERQLTPPAGTRSPLQPHEH